MGYKSKASAAKRDIHQEITDRFVAALETGTKPWRRPWGELGGNAGPTRSNGQEYRGLNWLLLSLEASAKGYASNRWMTYKQAETLGGQVRKGEKSTEVIFYKRLEFTEKDETTGEDKKKSIPLLRSYRVFNADQIDGLPARFQPVTVERTAAERTEAEKLAEATLWAAGAVIHEGGNAAFYRPSTDDITIPKREAFHTEGGRLATLAHELVHWTGHTSRLDRLKATARFGSESYAFEELVAELGSTFVTAHLGVDGELFDNHAAYLASWLKVLKGDKTAIFKAATLAQAAADMVLRRSGAQAEIDEEDNAANAPAAIAA